ncbi:MAG: hypothetical protein WAT19_03280 [Ferruginibacter sp.]
MRLTRKYLFAACLSLITASMIISCQKELHGDLYPPPPVDTTGNQPTNTSRDSIYINSIARTKLNGSQYDTMVKTFFTYDAQRRLKGWRDFPVTNADYLESMEFTYNGTDTLPYQARYTHKDVASPDSVIEMHYFFFDAAARKTKDSVIKINSASADNGGWVDRYYYPPGKSVTIGRWEDINGVYNYADTAILDANNNIVSAKFFSGSNYEYILQCTYQYDNKFHPFSRTNIYKAIPKNIGGGFPQKYNAFNNITYQKLNYFNINYVDEISNTITYNRFDLPAIIDRVANHGNPYRLFLTYRSFN